MNTTNSNKKPTASMPKPKQPVSPTSGGKPSTGKTPKR